MAVMFDSVGAPYKVKYAARIIFKAIIDLKHRPTDWLFEVTKQSVVSYFTVCMFVLLPSLYSSSTKCLFRLAVNLMQPATADVHCSQK